MQLTLFGKLVVGGTLRRLSLMTHSHTRRLQMLLGTQSELMRTPFPHFGYCGAGGGGVGCGVATLRQRQVSRVMAVAAVAKIQSSLTFAPV